MVKHTQTISLLPNFLSVFDHFVGLALKGLKNINFLLNYQGFSCGFQGFSNYFDLVFESVPAKKDATLTPH